MNYLENGILINAHGSDNITLWFLSGDRIRKQYLRNRSWIFVSADPYDLERLEDELENSRYFRSQRSSERSIYGDVHGIRIYGKPSRFKYLLNAISQIGLNRKFQVFNADINPVLRFVSENNYRFFELQDYMDRDPEIAGTKILPRIRGGDIVSVEIDGRRYESLDRRFYSDAAQSISQNILLVYGNAGGAFTRIMQKLLDLGYSDESIRVDPGSIYQSYGRVLYKNQSIHMRGKICINNDSFIYSEADLSGIYQISRISSLPPEIAASVTPGTAVSSLEVSRAVRNSVLVTTYKDDHEYEKSPAELLSTDRGGLVLDPEPGVYEDVYEIDFSSMYPSIMVRYNLSPETVTRHGEAAVPDTPYYISLKERGFLSEALEDLLQTRLSYKAIKSLDPLYKQRDTALKWLLLTSFGYTGYKNAKFGKIEVHEAITATGRWILSTAMQIAREMGFSVIHGIVDSLWIHGTADVNDLMRRIKARTRIDIVMDGHYRWIAFLPSRNGSGSPNSYIGLRFDGTYKLRGIMARRSDAPAIAKRMQVECLEIIKDCKTAADIADKYNKLRAVKNRYIRSLGSGPREDFLISYRISKRAEEYRVNTIQKEIARTFQSGYTEINPGESADVIVSDGKRKVIDIKGNGSIDREFYRKYLDRAFECFSFLSRHVDRKKATLYDPVYSLSSQKAGPEEHR